MLIAQLIIRQRDVQGERQRAELAEEGQGFEVPARDRIFQTQHIPHGGQLLGQLACGRHIFKTLVRIEDDLEGRSAGIANCLTPLDDRIGAGTLELDAIKPLRLPLGRLPGCVSHRAMARPITTINFLAIAPTEQRTDG